MPETALNVIGTGVVAVAVKLAVLVAGVVAVAVLAWFLPGSFSKGNGHGQHAVINVRMMTNGPIRAEHVNRSSTVNG